MKTIKTIDCWVNIGLMVGSVIAVLVNQTNLLKAYFVVGGWQLLSMITHTINGWFMKKGGARNVFQWVVVSILILVLLSQAITPFLLIFFILLMGSPVLALIYTKICYDELAELGLRHALSLK